MNCQEVMVYMQRHLDHDLSGNEQHMMNNHLESCMSCRKMMERLQRLTSELSSLPKVHPPVSLVDKILPRLAEIDRQRESSSIASDSVQHGQDRATTALRRRKISNMILGGVVAAGVLLGVVILNIDQDDPARMADSSGLMNQEISLDVADMALDQYELDGIAAQTFDVKVQEAAADESGNTSFLGIRSTSDADASSGMPLLPPTGGDTGSDHPPLGLTGYKQEGAGLDPDFEAVEIKDQFGNVTDMDTNDYHTSMGGFMSPDGQYSAYIENGSVVIVNDQREKIYISRSFKDAEISDLVWEQRSRLVFMIQTADTTYSYYIDLLEKTEGKL